MPAFSSEKGYKAARRLLGMNALAMPLTTDQLFTEFLQAVEKIPADDAVFVLTVDGEPLGAFKTLPVATQRHEALTAQRPSAVIAVHRVPLA